MTDENLQYPFVSNEDAGPQFQRHDNPKPAAKKSYFFAALIAILVTLVTVAIAARYWIAENSSGRYNLGTVVSSPDGLNGHLFTEWDGRLEYRIRIEPGDQSQLAGFALAVSHAPRPVSFYIQLLDPHDFALCSANILLKYEPSNAAEELEREHGKDLFQNELDRDGHIVAIRSRGVLPCSKSAWVKAVSWNFTSNFPSLDEQSALEDASAEAQASAAKLPSQIAARKKKTLRSAQNLASYSIEGDDAIVEYDVTRGIIETSGGKTFFTYKSGKDVDSSWHDYPVSIHYRCDRTSTCTLMHAGAGALSARMSR
jgi:hypothetical protein